MLSNSPGSLGFEMAPFKLPQDYIDILGGFDSPRFAEFRALFKRCFRDARKHAERIITLVELMQKGALCSLIASLAGATNSPSRSRPRRLVVAVLRQRRPDLAAAARAVHAVAATGAARRVRRQAHPQLGAELVHAPV